MPAQVLAREAQSMAVVLPVGLDLPCFTMKGKETMKSFFESEIIRDLNQLQPCSLSPVIHPLPYRLKFSASVLP